MHSEKDKQESLPKVFGHAITALCVGPFLVSAIFSCAQIYPATYAIHWITSDRGRFSLTLAIAINFALLSIPILGILLLVLWIKTRLFPLKGVTGPNKRNLQSSAFPRCSSTQRLVFQPARPHLAVVMFRPRPKRSFNVIARDLAEVVFALHPTAQDRVVVRLKGDIVHEMEVPQLDAQRPTASSANPSLAIARISELAAELRRDGLRPQEEELTVMRDRVIWMPSVVPFQPPIP